MAKTDAKAAPAEETQAATEGGEPQVTGAPIEPDAIEAAEVAADAALGEDVPAAATQGQEAPSPLDTPAVIEPEAEAVAEVDAAAAAEAEAHAAALAAVDRTEYLATLSALFRAALGSGVTVDDVRYPTDDAGKAALIEAAVFGGPDGVLLINAAGEVMRLSLDQFQRVIEGVRDHRQACFENAQRLHAELFANLTPIMVDLSEGWPA